MGWPDYRRIITVVDVLDTGACLDGVLAWIERNGDVIQIDLASALDPFDPYILYAANGRELSFRRGDPAYGESQYGGGDGIGYLTGSGSADFGNGWQDQDSYGFGTHYGYSEHGGEGNSCGYGLGYGDLNGDGWGYGDQYGDGCGDGGGWGMGGDRPTESGWGMGGDIAPQMEEA